MPFLLATHVVVVTSELHTVHTMCSDIELVLGWFGRLCNSGNLKSDSSLCFFLFFCKLNL